MASDVVITRFDYYVKLVSKTGTVPGGLDVTIRHKNYKNTCFVLIMPSTLAVMFSYQVFVQVIVGLSCLVFAALLCNLHKTTGLDCKWPSNSAGFDSVKKLEHFILKLSGIISALYRTVCSYKSYLKCYQNLGFWCHSSGPFMPTIL